METQVTDADLGSSFVPHIPPPDDWFYYHPTFCSPEPASSSSEQSTPVCDPSDGVPCLVPSSLMPRYTDDTHKSDHGDVDQFGASNMAFYSAAYKYPTLHPYFSQVPCVPSMPFTEEMWMHCPPDSQPSSQEFRKHLEDAEMGMKLGETFQGHEKTCFIGQDTETGFSPEKPTFPRSIKDPNVLPVVDLTKSEMEIFTIQDFKDQKLDFFQKKTKDEKSTVLVVCIDQGMCAAFHLPKDDAHPDENNKVDTKIPKSVIPPSMSHGREYMSVKKSLDKVFPSFIGNNPNIARSSDNSLFEKEAHRMYLNNSSNEQEEAIRHIPVSASVFDY